MDPILAFGLGWVAGVITSVAAIGALAITYAVKRSKQQ